MNNFCLHERLADDCFVLCENKQFIFLLMNNALLPWFILVPKTDKSELYQLDELTQLRLLKAINHISTILSIDYKPDKLNVAAIGNIVQQMHIHIVVRYKNDPFWPGVVWGATAKQAYQADAVARIKSQLNNILEI